MDTRDIVDIFNRFDISSIKDDSKYKISTLGSITNLNYKVEIGDKKFVLRVPGENPDLINRLSEGYNEKLIQSIGISLPLIVFEEETGLKISEYFDVNTIDILVNNTQGPIAGDVNSVSINDYQNAFDLLFKNIVLTTTLALKNMKKNEWGRIINMASVSVKEPLRYLALSNTIRSALTTWGKTLSNEVAKSNITVNNILTGYFNTERLEQLNSEKAKKMGIKVEEVFDAMRNQVPAKRIGISPSP